MVISVELKCRGEGRAENSSFLLVDSLPPHPTPAMSQLQKKGLFVSVEFFAPPPPTPASWLCQTVWWGNL